MSADEPGSEPPAPEGVVLVDADGNDYPAVVAFAGHGHDGIARWYVLVDAPGPWRGVKIGVLPARCELVVPFEVD